MVRTASCMTPVTANSEQKKAFVNQEKTGCGVGHEVQEPQGPPLLRRKC